MADPLLNLSVTTSSPKIVSSPKPFVNHKKKSTPKKMIGDSLDSTVEQELSLIKLDGIHVTGNNENFVTERKWVTDSSENYVTEKKLKRLAVKKEVLSTSMEKYCLASRYLRRMVDLKKKKKTSELQSLQNEVMEKFSSKRDFAFFSSFILYIFHSHIFRLKLKTYLFLCSLYLSFHFVTVYEYFTQTLCNVFISFSSFSFIIFS